MTFAGALLNDLRIVNDEEAFARIEAELAAAEERGFRRGIECAARALESPTLTGDLPWPEAAELVRGLLP